MELKTIEKTLKTCPFCGSHNVRVNGVIFPSAACEDCKCYGPVGFSKEDAVNKWNKMVNKREDAQTFEIVVTKDKHVEV